MLAQVGMAQNVRKAEHKFHAAGAGALREVQQAMGRNVAGGRGQVKSVARYLGNLSHVAGYTGPNMNNVNK